MSWGAKQSATQLVNITATEQFFSTLISLNPGESAHCQVDYNPVGAPTDDLVVSVYTTLDAAAENWDDTPSQQFQISRLIDPNSKSFVVEGVYKFRVGVKRSGVTDTITSADLFYRLNGINL